MILDRDSRLLAGLSPFRFGENGSQISFGRQPMYDLSTRPRVSLKDACRAATQASATVAVCSGLLFDQRVAKIGPIVAEI